MLYLCTSKEEKALNKRVFSSFFGQKNGQFTSDVEKSTLLRKFFLGVCGFFLSNVGGFLGDVGRQKLKDIYFLDSIFLLLEHGSNVKIPHLASKVRYFLDTPNVNFRLSKNLTLARPTCKEIAIFLS